MSNEITTQEQNEAGKVTKELLAAYLKANTKGLTDEQRSQFVAVAMSFGLNPFKREIYAVTYKNKQGGTDLSIVTGYETYLKRAELNPNYDGFDIKFKGAIKRENVTKHGYNGDYQKTVIVPDGDFSCECTVYRKDRNHPIVEEVFFDEFDQGNSMWQSKPRLMLKKVAIANAFRKAFPLEFGGMPYTSDELPERMGITNESASQAEITQPAPQSAPAPETPKASTKAKKAKKTEPVEAEITVPSPEQPSEPALDLDQQRTQFIAWVEAKERKFGDQAVLDAIGAAGYNCADEVPNDPEKMRSVMLTIKNILRA